MPDRPHDSEKARAWSEMKAAVRAYAQDPSGEATGGVKLACDRLRRAEADSLLARGRAAGAARTAPPPGSDDATED